MNTLPSGNGVSSLTGDPCSYGISHTRADNNTTNNVHGNSNTNFAGVSNSYNNINVGLSEESSRIQAWLSPLEPHVRNQDVRNRRLEGVGDWVLQMNEFESWRESQDASMDHTLLCYGDQGVGKTYISSLVIDTLSKHACEKNIAVLSLYCDYQDQKDQSAVNMIGSLLKQIALGGVGIVGEIKNAFDRSRQGGGKCLRLPEMLGLFVKTIGSLERVYICVDAMDELVPQHRSEFLCALRQIIQEAPNTRLFLTGRPHVRGELDKHLTKGAYIIHIVPDHGDIAKYLRRKMDDDDDRDPDLMTEKLKNDIMKTMLEKASEMFLLVALNIDAILGEISLPRRKKMLQKVATAGVDLDTVYDQTLRRIKEQKGDRPRLGMEVLMWVSHAERPLRIDELCHALAVEIEATDLDPENIRPQDTVLGSCLGLAVIDKKTSQVRLIHYTLQEYLSRSGVLPDAHKTLGQTCLTYLNYEQVKRIPADNVSTLENMPFLEYSSLHWGRHAKIELSHHAKSLALDLLTRYDDHISSVLLAERICPSWLHPLSHRPFPGLHCASYFGIDEVIATWIEMESYKFNQRDFIGFTPLSWAARQGNQGAVALLLTRDDIGPDEPDNYGSTPLWHASSNGHEGVVRLLLARDDVDPDKPNNDGRTPLWGASSNGHEGVVRLLLARGNVDPNKPDNDGRTPLWHASLNANESVVKLLLSRNDVNPDKPDNDGRTLLWWASRSGKTGAVSGLLTRDDVNPDKPDESGQTPLSAASGNGHEAVVRLLLARGNVDPNKPDNDGRTPLWHASLNANESVVKFLLSRNDVNPDKPDSHGRTLLWWASGSGKTEAVRGLLTRPDVDPDKPDNIGRTPFLIASIHGHREVVALLKHRALSGPLPLYPLDDGPYSVPGLLLSHAPDLGRLPRYPGDDDSDSDLSAPSKSPDGLYDDDSKISVPSPPPRYPIKPHDVHELYSTPSTAHSHATPAKETSKTGQMQTPEIALCSFCGRIVTQFEPRYHCMSCVNYDLCSGCQKEAQPSNGHTKDHKLYQLKVGVSLQNGFPLFGGGTPLQYAPGEPHPFWGRMITEKKTPSDRFGRLIDSIHYSISHAREPRSGNFEPEKASYVMALLGYHERDNIFHLFITSSMQNPHGLAWSDQQTLLIYQICGWDSQQGTRSHDQQMNSVPVEHRQTFTPVEGGMPLLTRSGLRDMIIMEALADPQGFCERFNDLLSVANTEQTPLIGEGGYRFPDGPIGLKCWPMRPDREAEATRSKMREIARALIGSNWNAIFAHMG